MEGAMGGEGGAMVVRESKGTPWGSEGVSGGCD